MKTATRFSPTHMLRTTEVWPSAVGAWNPGRSVTSSSMSGVPSASTAPAQPEPSTTMASKESAPAWDSNSCAAEPASSSAFSVVRGGCSVSLTRRMLPLCNGIVPERNAGCQAGGMTVHMADNGRKR